MGHKVAIFSHRTIKPPIHPPDHLDSFHTSWLSSCQFLSNVMVIQSSVGSGERRFSISGSSLHISGGPYSTHYKLQGLNRNKEETIKLLVLDSSFLVKINIHRVTTSRQWLPPSASLQSLFIQRILLK